MSGSLKVDEVHNYAKLGMRCVQYQHSAGWANSGSMQAPRASPLLVCYPSLTCHCPLVPLPLPISSQVDHLHTHTSKIIEG